MILESRKTKIRCKVISPTSFITHEFEKNYANIYLKYYTKSDTYFFAIDINKKTIYQYPMKPHEIDFLFNTISNIKFLIDNNSDIIPTISHFHSNITFFKIYPPNNTKIVEIYYYELSNLTSYTIPIDINKLILIYHNFKNELTNGNNI